MKCLKPLRNSNYELRITNYELREAVLVVSVLRDDWMIGVIGVIILSVGNAGLMLLAHVLKRMNAA